MGVADHVRLIDGFVEHAKLMTYLTAADVYVTPYLNEAQITSGTLSYAVALGKPVVSTPYWHAAELLDESFGRVVPAGDDVGFAAAIIDLLANPTRLEAMRHAAWAVGRSMTWDNLAASYVAIFRAACAARPHLLFRADPRPMMCGRWTAQKPTGFISTSWTAASCPTSPSASRPLARFVDARRSRSTST